MRRHDYPTERLSADAFADMLLCCGPDLSTRLGAHVESRPGVSLHMAAALDHLLFNRAILSPGPAASVDDAIGWAVQQFEAAGVSRYFVQVDPALHGAQTDSALRTRGLTPYHRAWVQLVRDCGAFEPVMPRDLRVEPARAEHAPLLAELLCDAFDAPVRSAPLFEGLVTRSGWHVHAALDAGRPVAVGALFVSGRGGYLGFAATAPSHRGRGAQQALIASRIRTARELGCRWLLSETGEPVPGQRNTSCNNLQRAGFVSAGVHLNYTLPGVTWATEQRPSAGVHA